MSQCPNFANVLSAGSSGKLNIHTHRAFNREAACLPKKERSKVISCLIIQLFS